MSGPSDRRPGRSRGRSRKRPLEPESAQANLEIGAVVVVAAVARLVADGVQTPDPGQLGLLVRPRIGRRLDTGLDAVANAGIRARDLGHLRLLMIRREVGSRIGAGESPLPPVVVEV